MDLLNLSPAEQQALIVNEYKQNAIANQKSLSTELALIETAVLVFYLIGMATFYFFREVDIIRKRNLTMIITGSVSSLLLVMWMIAFEPRYFWLPGTISVPCWAYMLVIYLVAPITAYCYIVRSLALIYTNCINQSKLAQSTGKSSVYSSLTLSEKFAIRFFGLFSTKSSRATQVDDKSRSVSKANSSLEMTSIANTQMKEDKKKMNISSEISTWTFVKACVPVVLLNFIIFLVSFGVYHGQVLDFCGSTNLLTAKDPFKPLLTYLLVIVILIFCLLIVSIKIQDALYVKYEYLISSSFFIVALAIYCVDTFNIGNSQGKFTGNSQNIGADIYFIVALLLYFFLAVLIPLSSVISAKLLNPSLKMDIASFNRALTDADKLEQLKKMMAAEFCVENGIFLQEVQKLIPLTAEEEKDLKKGTGTSSIDLLAKSVNSLLNREPSKHMIDGNTAKKETSEDTEAQLVKRLYKKFIQSGSVYELNIPGTLQAAVAKEINDKNYSKSILLPVLKEVRKMVYTNTFPRYVRANGNKL